MSQVEIGLSNVNLEALDAALRSALGSVTTGVSTGSGRVTVHLLDSASPAQREQAQQIVLAHDPALLTPQQQAEAARQEHLVKARTAHGASDLDLSAYIAQPTLIQTLAGKIAWLEQEIRALRGG